MHLRRGKLRRGELFGRFEGHKKIGTFSAAHLQVISEELSISTAVFVGGILVFF
jgi:hypothetical protein